MEWFQLFVWGMTAAMGFYMLSRLVKARSVAGMMLGAPIRRTVGEVQVTARRVRQVARIHVLESTEPDRAVGFELTSKAGLSYGIVPLSLSKEQARRLAQLLEEAASAVK
jgi:hypothetical protein